MLKSSKTATNAEQASARVVDGKLILSLPHAKSPIVWQMDLDQAKASALEVRSNEEQANFTLILKTPRGDTTDIASFTAKAGAVDSLMAASQALENAQGHIRQGQENASSTPANTNTPSDKTRKGWGKWIIGLISIVAIWFLYSLSMTFVLPAPPQSYAPQAPAQATSANSAPSPRSSNGVAVSADEFLAR